MPTFTNSRTGRKVELPETQDIRPQRFKTVGEWRAAVHANQTLAAMQSSRKWARKGAKPEPEQRIETQEQLDAEAQQQVEDKEKAQQEEPEAQRRRRGT